MGRSKTKVCTSVKEKEASFWQTQTSETSKRDEKRGLFLRNEVSFLRQANENEKRVFCVFTRILKFLPWCLQGAVTRI